MIKNIRKICTYLFAIACLLAIGQAPAFAKVLAPGASIPSGGSLLSDNYKYEMVMQTDGNLVVYRRADRRVIWNSRTNVPGSTAVMQNDGNFVVYTPNWQAVWHSVTGNSSGAALAMQNDGNAVVYSTAGQPIWASGGDTSPITGILPIDLLVVVPDQDMKNGYPVITCTNQPPYFKVFDLNGNNYCAWKGMPGAQFIGTQTTNVPGQYNAAQEALRATSKTTQYGYNVIGIVVVSRLDPIFKSDLEPRLNALRQNANIRSIRDQLGADVVVSMKDSDTFTGMASMLAVHKDEAFVTISYIQDQDAYSLTPGNTIKGSRAMLAHEIGHVLGLAHDPKAIVDGGFKDSPIYSYAVGSSTLASGSTPAYGDIMAYDTVRELRYSAAGEYTCGPSGTSTCSYPYYGYVPDAKRALFVGDSNGWNPSTWEIVSNFRYRR